MRINLSNQWTRKSEFAQWLTDRGHQVTMDCGMVVDSEIVEVPTSIDWIPCDRNWVEGFLIGMYRNFIIERELNKRTG